MLRRVIRPCRVAIRGLIAACASLLSLTSLSPSALVAESLQTRWRGGDLFLETSPGRAVLEFPGGGELSVALAPTARVDALAAIADSGRGQLWVAAGSREAAAGSSELFVLAGDQGRSWELRPPGSSPAERVRSRSNAVLLVRRGTLDGLAWLEGDSPREHTVWAAEWNGEGFARRRQIAGPGRGSQLALTGAALADGSWLLAWSSFDGEDDEIVYRTRVDGEWQPIRRRSDNRVPDITPRLAATAEGALLAWSVYDGNDYRLMLSRFASGGWDKPRAVGGAGSLYPTWLAGEHAPRVLFFQARPRGWAVLELDGEGAVKRTAFVETAEADAPLVEASPESVTLSWAGVGRRSSRAPWQEP